MTEIPAGSGQHGYPYDAASLSMNLGAVGYTEREFLMSGTTNLYQQAGSWSSNGMWNVSVSQGDVPYTTRLLVRYPTDPAKFNGTVVFEWMNDTTGGDQDPVWAQMVNELTGQGFAYVGVTAQRTGMGYLRSWDPQRYGSLGDTDDSQSYDIFTQAAQVAKADSATILGGLVPRELVGTGDSQSAFRVDTYINAFQPRAHVYDGFIAVGRWAGAAPLGNGFVNLIDPSYVRSDNTAPLIQVDSQGDIEQLGARAASQPDNAYLRTWDVAGTSHIDDHEAGYEVAAEIKEWPGISVVPNCTLGTPIEGTGTPLDGVNQADDMPLWEVEDASLAAMQRWLVDGVQPPHAPSLGVVPFYLGVLPDDLVPTNQYGIASGGIQLPEAQVPAEYYQPINFSIGTAADYTPLALYGDLQTEINLYATGGLSITDTAARSLGLCLLSGYFTNLSSSALQALYPTTAAYVSKYTAAVNSDVAAGFMTPQDAALAIANAQAGRGPVQGPPPLNIP